MAVFEKDWKIYRNLVAASQNATSTTSPYQVNDLIGLQLSDGSLLLLVFDRGGVETSSTLSIYLLCAASRAAALKLVTATCHCCLETRTDV